MVIIHSGLVLTRTCSSRLQPPYLVLRRRFSGGATACSVSLNGKRNSEKEKVIVISGPTGAGKSRLALELAKCLNGEIISADSVQVPMSHFHLLLVCSLWLSSLCLNPWPFDRVLNHKVEYFTLPQDCVLSVQEFCLFDPIVSEMLKLKFLIKVHNFGVINK